MTLADEAIIAAAGSGKTTYLIEKALSEPEKRVLFVTYTNENLREINHRLWEWNGTHPKNVETMTLFEFLLRECVKPYQTFKTDIGRIKSINFVTENPPFSAKTDFDKYYLDSSNNIYSDAVSDLACEINAASGGWVIQRLEAIYDKILIDEMQDLAGWDLEFIQELLNSSIQVVMAGDIRQAIYLSNRSPKNSQYRGAKFANWIHSKQSSDECRMTQFNQSYRCCQTICDFADSLYPSLPHTVSLNLERSGHDGVFLIHISDLDSYRSTYQPQELRWNRQNTVASSDARNYGQVKGLEFSRVLIHPTQAITGFIENHSALPEVSAAKFYVAITRARQSVGIVTHNRTTRSNIPFWTL